MCFVVFFGGGVNEYGCWMLFFKVFVDDCDFGEDLFVVECESGVLICRGDFG